jgi:hypothetical protein
MPEAERQASAQIQRMAGGEGGFDQRAGGLQIAHFPQQITQHQAGLGSVFNRLHGLEGGTGSLGIPCYLVQHSQRAAKRGETHRGGFETREEGEQFQRVRAGD